MPPRTRQTPADEPAQDRPEATNVVTEQQLEPPSVHVALSRVMRDTGAVGKDGVNTAQNFKFRGVDAVVNAVHPALVKHGVVVTPDVKSCDYSSAPTARGGVVTVVRIRVRYTFTGPAGDTLKTTVVAESFDSGDKATAKAMSVAFRTALLQTLTLPTDEPDDPDHATFERSGPGVQQQPDNRPPATPRAQRQQRAETPPEQSPTVAAELKSAAANAFRRSIIKAIDETEPGVHRDGKLRPLRDEIAELNGLGNVVDLPSGWGSGKITLERLILGGRGERRPSGEEVVPAAAAAADEHDPWATPAPAIDQDGAPTDDNR